MSRPFDIPKLVIAITLISVLTMAVRVPASPDTWWHLRCGQVQWHTRSVLKKDVFSHTAAGTPWVNQSWLPQLIMYGLYMLGDFQALALAVGALVTATFALILATGRSEGRYGHFWRAFVVLWATIATGRVWAARPHLITFFLTAVWVYLLDRHRQKPEQKIGVLRWLPPLMMLWANCHGGYIVGFFLLGSEISGTLVDALWQRQFRDGWKRARPLLIVTLLCIITALINPQGVRLMLFPLQTLRSAAQQDAIAEWASPDFHALDLLPFLALLLATWSALAFSGQQVNGVEWARLLGFTAMALRSGRYLGLSAVIMAPILMDYGALVLTRLGTNWGLRPSIAPPTRGRPLLNWVLLFTILLAAGIKISLPLSKETIAQAQNRIFPTQAVAYMRSHDLPPNLFNEYGWGGYLIWELYPGTPVFIDGRADPYGDELILAYRHVASAQAGWENVLDEYSVHTALVTAHGALASVMRESQTWQEVYVDDMAIIFVDNSSE
jgi:hypothetical protein